MLPLAFVPVSDVVANFESLATTFLNDELPLLGYFESTWIGQSVGGRKLPPMFSHHMWNVLDRAGTGSTRTTNALESFHHSFNSLLSCTHPASWIPGSTAEPDQITDAEDKQRRHFQGFSHQQKKKRTDHEPHLPLHSIQYHGFPQRHWLQLPHLNLLMFHILIFWVNFYCLILIIT